MVLNTEIDRSKEGREERRRGEKGGRVDNIGLDWLAEWPGD